MYPASLRFRASLNSVRGATKKWPGQLDTVAVSMPSCRPSIKKSSSFLPLPAIELTSIEGGDHGAPISLQTAAPLTTPKLVAVSASMSSNNTLVALQSSSL